MVALPGSEAGLAGYETIHYWLTLVIIPGSSACVRGWEWYKYFWHSMTSSYSEKLLFDDFTNVLWPQRALDGSVPFYKHLYKNKTHTVTYTSSHVEQVNILVSFLLHHKKISSNLGMLHVQVCSSTSLSDILVELFRCLTRMETAIDYWLYL